MKLSYKQYSTDGEPLIILHGLFGNQGNWAVHAKQLANHYAVVAFDARNHGSSPWADSMSYDEMAEDVIDTMDELGIGRAHFLAHSMGGKTAMQVALSHPDRVNKLIVVDIAPVAYSAESNAALDGLQALDLETIASRKEADQGLAQYIDDEGVRSFLLTNLRRGKDKSFCWRFNLAALVSNIEAIKGGVSGVYDGEVLFIKGANSDYIIEDYRQQTFEHFPQAKIKIIANAGHWVHSEKPAALLKIVEKYL